MTRFISLPSVKALVRCNSSSDSKFVSILGWWLRPVIFRLLWSSTSLLTCFTCKYLVWCKFKIGVFAKCDYVIHIFYTTYIYKHPPNPKSIIITFFAKGVKKLKQACSCEGNNFTFLGQAFLSSFFSSLGEKIQGKTQ